MAIIMRGRGISISWPCALSEAGGQILKLCKAYTREKRCKMSEMSL